MIIKSAVILIEIIVAYLLQTAVFSNLRLADVVPDIFIILTACLNILICLFVYSVS